MPHEIGTALEETTIRNNPTAWAWLFDVDIDDDQIAYLTTNNESVTWGGNTYLPYPMTVPTIPEEQSTASETIQLTVYQIDDLLTDYLRDGVVLGGRVVLRLVHLDHLSETSVIEHEATILGAEVARRNKTVTLTLGSHPWMSRLLGRRFLRLRCRHVYGSAACGFDVTRSGAMATCSRLYSDGSTGCVEHGAEEAAAGLYQHHPARFGGFPGLPRQNRG